MRRRKAFGGNTDDHLPGMNDIVSARILFVAPPSHRWSTHESIPGACEGLSLIQAQGDSNDVRPIRFQHERARMARQHNLGISTMRPLAPEQQDSEPHRNHASSSESVQHPVSSCCSPEQATRLRVFGFPYLGPGQPTSGATRSAWNRKSDLQEQASSSHRKRTSKTRCFTVVPVKIEGFLNLFVETRVSAREALTVRKSRFRPLDPQRFLSVA